MDTESVKETLVERRVELSAELSRLTAPPEQGVGIGFGKRVGDGTSEAVERLATTATARSIAKSISEIDQALSRLDSGRYGLCDVCGEMIPPARLEARPATVTCVDCAGNRD
ncbi:MAG TPA: TraR/DksA C4-type zinc finger protein [Acidimicrobiia bacterium]